MVNAPLLAGEMKDAMRNWVTADDWNRHGTQSEDLLRMDIRHNHLGKISCRLNQN